MTKLQLHKLRQRLANRMRTGLKLGKKALADWERSGRSLNELNELIKSVADGKKIDEGSGNRVALLARLGMDLALLSIFNDLVKQA